MLHSRHLPVCKTAHSTKVWLVLQLHDVCHPDPTVDTVHVGLLIQSQESDGMCFKDLNCDIIMNATMSWICILLLFYNATVLESWYQYQFCSLELQQHENLCCVVEFLPGEGDNIVKGRRQVTDAPLRLARCFSSCWALRWLAPLHMRTAVLTLCGCCAPPKLTDYRDSFLSPAVLHPSHFQMMAFNWSHCSLNQVFPFWSPLSIAV